ncbi:MAG: glycosyltransferase family 4 protein [Rhodospirillales bacterium]|nr:MAG: glycosyltransferase family 4 protein [Rhodospirillales bacterium]
MKLLFCIKAMNNPGGGAERVLAIVANGLLGRGHQVSVLSFDQPGGPCFYPLEPGIGRLDLGIGSTSRRATVFGTLRRIAALRRRVHAVAPDVAIGFMHSMFVPLGLALWGSAIPVVASEHIVPEHYASRPLEAALLRLTPWIATRITCVSESVKATYPPALRRKMTAIANPVVVDGGGRADVAGEGRARKAVLSVGRLEPQKDHATLIEAFALIAKDLPEWDLRILGDGGLRPDLEALVARYRLDQRVHFCGTTRDVSVEYLAAQLFVTPSRYESFGLSTAEALAYGLPVVGFADCPGTNQLIRPGVNGELADGSGDRAAALARTLWPLMKDPARRIDLVDRNGGIPESCRPDAVIDAWENLLVDVLRSRREAGRGEKRLGFRA